MLHAAAEQGAEVTMVFEPLCIVYAEDHRTHVGSSYDWRLSLAWAHGIRSHMTRRAYAGFLMYAISDRPADAHDWKACFVLLWNAFRDGCPTLLSVLHYLAILTIPRHLRRRGRAFVFRRSSRARARLRSRDERWGARVGPARRSAGGVVGIGRRAHRMGVSWLGRHRQITLISGSASAAGRP
jgi:hypothetical protein